MFNTIYLDIWVVYKGYYSKTEVMSWFVHMYMQQCNPLHKCIIATYTCTKTQQDFTLIPDLACLYRNKQMLKYL